MAEAPVPTTTAQEEHRFHYYTGNTVPAFVYLIWIAFWAFCIYYHVRYLLPALATELLSPP